MTENKDGAGTGARERRRGGSGNGGGAGSGVDGQFISKLARRLADSFPLLTADEINKEVNKLLHPETAKGDSATKVRGMGHGEGGAGGTHLVLVLGPSDR